MNDRTDPNLILGYVEGELPADERQRVEAMLAEDAALGDLVRGMQADREALRSAAPAEPPRDLAEAALATLERSMLLDGDVAVPSPTVAAPVNRFRLAPLLTYGGIAAVLAITATVVFQSLQSDRQPASSPTLAMEDSGGVGLAEAPIAAQRDLARGETLAAADEVPEMLLQDSLAKESADAEGAPTELAAVTMGRDAEAARAANEAETRASAVAGNLAEASEPATSALPLAERFEGRTRMAGTDTLGDNAAAGDSEGSGGFGDSGGFGGSGGYVSPPPTGEALARVDLDGWSAHDDLAAGLAGRDNAAPFTDATTEPDRVSTSFFVRAEANPRYTVNVYTRSADQTLEQLNTWADSNSVAFAQDHTATAADPTPSDGFGARAQSTAGRESKQAAFRNVDLKRTDAADHNAVPARQQVVLILAPGQVDDLVNELNRDRLAQNALVKDNAPQDVRRFAHAPQTLPAAAQAPAPPELSETPTPGTKPAPAADSVRIKAEAAQPVELRELVGRAVEREAAVAEAELDAEAMLDAAIESSEERHRAPEPARGLASEVVLNDGVAEPRPALTAFDNRFAFNAWWNWAGPVAVEVVIEETPETLRAGPLRLDAESP